MVEHAGYRVNAAGKLSVIPRWHLQTGTYKQEFGGTGGWAVERIVMPKALGGIWLNLRPKKSGGVEISPAPAV
jgi:hypothetical protein